jgi:hypothetical protein
MIPKIIHYCWLSGDPFPAKVQECVASWERQLPDYELKKWDAAAVAAAFDINSVLWVRQAYETREYAFAADYIRFYALYHYGGIYLDSDVEVVKPFDDLLRYDTFFGYEYTAMPEAAVIGATMGQSWLKECLVWYESHSFLDKDGRQQRVIAPLVLKSGYEKATSVKLLDMDVPFQHDNHIILPHEYFSSKNGFSGKIANTANSYTIHHFESAWLKRNGKIKIKKLLHLFFIGLFGKLNYNKIMYHLRQKDKQI